LRNIALLIEYDGTAYGGWQIQKNSRSIQGVLEESLSALLHDKIKVIGAGRTDAGVHAVGQVANFHIRFPKPETLSGTDASKIARALNAVLPPDIAIRRAVDVPGDFHSRYDAVSRRYVYRVITRKSPLVRHMALLLHHRLSVDLMNEAAQFLIGRKSFKSFTKYADQQRHFICDLTKAEWSVETMDGNIGSQRLSFHNPFIVPHLRFNIEANRFLHGMVRAIVGTLIDVGRGKISMGQFKEIILSESRSFASMSVPPCGLCLEEVKYKTEIWTAESTPYL
jgi:tRNA pseudouridine38-40 synthase